MMGMSPNNFWNLSPQEVYLSIDGFSEFNGGKEKEAPMDKAKLHELMELYPD